MGVQFLGGTHRVQLAEGVPLPGLRVAAVAAAAAARLAHLVLVVAVGRHLEALYAQNARVVHACKKDE